MLLAKLPVRNLTSVALAITLSVGATCFGNEDQHATKRGFAFVERSPAKGSHASFLGMFITPLLLDLQVERAKG